MSEELTLPRLAWDSRTESFSNHRSRKRVRSSPPASSDPAIFSSDDDPSADNYTQDRRKKKYRGPWYQQRLASDSGMQEDESREQKKGKRIFERQYDSGVFMGSDGTDIDEPMEGLVLSQRPDVTIRQGLPVHLGVATPSPEDWATKQIQECLEEGNERIDLSSKGLTTLPNSTIRPLAAFTPVPSVAGNVFTKLESNLKIFLSTNQLTSLPRELFKLESLTVLILRSNKFEELPPAIGNLKNLEELNISQNRLRYLPFEILELFSMSSNLEKIHLHPNPFYEAKFPTGKNEDKPEEVQYKVGLGSPARTRPRRNAVGNQATPGVKAFHPRWKGTYKARTEVRYLDTTGVLMKGPVLVDFNTGSPGSAPKSLPVATAQEDYEPPNPRGNGISRSPSLLEVAINACSLAPQLSNLQSFLPDDSPRVLSGLLAKAIAKKESGGSKCTICKRNFIIPRTEWIEWWEIAKVLDDASPDRLASAASPLRMKENERDVLESMVPLMRRGCSWFCVPKKVQVAMRADEMDVDE
ncbi:hypothetical protein BGZ60DRAFT_48679 [Tricladium varicosporioides]|nr:hypothetical protein BGZ60DRAFT_48679 [Hymenoscyphus varicosporioides]